MSVCFIVHYIKVRSINMTYIDVISSSVQHIPVYTPFCVSKYECFTLTYIVYMIRVTYSFVRSLVSVSKDDCRLLTNICY